MGASRRPGMAKLPNESLCMTTLKGLIFRTDSSIWRGVANSLSTSKRNI